MKILHTADWHIGQFKGPVEDGVNLRSLDTIKCLEYMVKVAEEEKKYTKYVRNKQIGIKFAEETDTAKFRSSLIYHATVEEDRIKLWDNQQVWEGLRKQGVLVVTALDVIEAVLLGGEKDRVIDEINKLSGFDSENLEEVENKMEEAAKN